MGFNTKPGFPAAAPLAGEKKEALQMAFKSELPNDMTYTTIQNVGVSKIFLFDK